MIEEYLEDKSIYWNDDIEIVETFALKTIKKFEEKKGSKQSLIANVQGFGRQGFRNQSYSVKVC